MNIVLFFRHNFWLGERIWIIEHSLERFYCPLQHIFKVLSNFTALLKNYSFFKNLFFESFFVCRLNTPPKTIGEIIKIFSLLFSTFTALIASRRIPWSDIPWSVLRSRRDICHQLLNTNLNVRHNMKKINAKRTHFQLFYH